MYVSRAAFHVYMNDTESAFVDLERYESLEENPTEKVNAYFWLGWYLCHVPQDRIDPEIAVKLLDRAYVLRSDRNNEWNVGVLGIAHYRAGHWKDAIDWIGKAVEMSRDSGVYYYAFIMAMAHWQAGDKEQAHACYERTVAWLIRRVAAGKPPLEPAWYFYMEAAELMGLKTRLFEDEAPATGQQ